MRGKRLFLIVACVLLLAPFAVEASITNGTIDSTDKYARIQNTDSLINLGPADAGIAVTDSSLTGEAWSEQYGWITFDPTNGGVTNDGEGNLAGYAWGEATGWINFNPTQGGVTIDNNGFFRGYAWAEAAGWIVFSCESDNSCATLDHKVRTDWRPQSVRPACNNSQDDDGDGDIDFPADGGCENADDDSEEGGGGSSGGGSTGGEDDDEEDDTATNTPPTISLLGSNPLTLTRGDTFVDPGARATDEEDGDLTNQIDVSGSIDTSAAGQYVITYSVVDSDGETATIQRRVIVEETGGGELDDDGDTEGGTSGGIAGGSGVKDDGEDEKGEGGTRATSTETIPSDDDDERFVPPSIDGKPSEPERSFFNPRTITPQIPEQIERFVPDSIVPAVKIAIPSGFLLSIFVGLFAPLMELLLAPATFGQILLGAFNMRLLLVRDWLTSLFPWLGLPRKHEPWGTVYDSVTKEPLDPAYVELKRPDGITTAEAITDLDGRYGFLVEPGTYRLEAHKTHYAFPSKRLKGKGHDAIYEHLYFGQLFEVSSDNPVVMLDVPMDPQAFDWNQYAKRTRGLMKLYSRYTGALRRVGTVLFYGGFLFSALFVFLLPTIFNFLVFAVYVVTAAARLLFNRQQKMGDIRDAHTGQPLSFASLEVMQSTTGQIVRRIVTDHLGRYYCLVSPGTYALVVKERTGPESFRELAKISPVKAPRGIIRRDIRV